MLKLEGNREIEAAWPAFERSLNLLKDGNPLKSPNGYYPYGTIRHIPQILPLADKHGVDLKASLASKTVLDLGTGDGDLAFFFEHLGAKQVVAIDFAPYNNNRLEGFRTLKQALGSRVDLLDEDVVRVDLGALPQFDTAFCFGFLYHSPHPVWVLEQLAGRTRELLLNTKVFDSPESYAYFYDEAECNNDSTNWWCFSPKALALMLKRTGFHVRFMERTDSWIGQSHPVDLARDGRMFAYAVRE